VTGIVANNEHELAGAASIGANQVSKIDTRDGGGGDTPRCRYGPVAAIDQIGGRISEASRLVLWQLGRGLHGCDQAGARTAIVAHSVYVDAIACSVGLDLETDGLTSIDADIRGETLNR
jgi:hypothetical protein